jgi:hypothetical protein
MSIVANLQAHQLVLTKELTEINNDLVALQQMGFRYEAQCGISFRPAVDHLVVLRAQKEGLLSQVNAQLGLVQDSLASSTQLVNQMNSTSFVGAAAAASPQKLSYPSFSVTASLPPSAVQLRPVSGTAASSAVHVTSADIVSSTLYGPQVVHIQGPSGLLVSTNSTILAHSPQRDRL